MPGFPEPDGEPEPELEAPARKTPARRKPAAKPRAASAPTSLQGQLRELIEAVGGAISFINPEDGRIVTVQAEPLASALDRLAKQNPNVRRVLQGLLVGGAWGEVLSIVVIGILFPIASNHQALPWQRKARGGPEASLPPSPPARPGPSPSGVREPVKPDPSGTGRNTQLEADRLLAELEQ